MKKALDKLAHRLLHWHSDLFGNHITTGSLVRHSNQVCYLCNISFEAKELKRKGK